jgi:hypothetical protein
MQQRRLPEPGRRRKQDEWLPRLLQCPDKTIADEQLARRISPFVWSLERNGARRWASIVQAAEILEFVHGSPIARSVRRNSLAGRRRVSARYSIEEGVGRQWSVHGAFG